MTNAALREVVRCFKEWVVPPALSEAMGGGDETLSERSSQVGSRILWPTPDASELWSQTRDDRNNETTERKLLAKLFSFPPFSWSADKENGVGVKEGGGAPFLIPKSRP